MSLLREYRQYIMRGVLPKKDDEAISASVAGRTDAEIATSFRLRTSNDTLLLQPVSSLAVPLTIGMTDSEGRSVRRICPVAATWTEGKVRLELFAFDRTSLCLRRFRYLSRNRFDTASVAAVTPASAAGVAGSWATTASTALPRSLKRASLVLRPLR